MAAQCVWHSYDLGTQQKAHDKVVLLSGQLSIHGMPDFLPGASPVAKVCSDFLTFPLFPVA